MAGQRNFKPDKFNTFYVTWAEKNQNFTENAWARPEILQFLKANISYTITP